MASHTPNLDLLKKDPVTDGSETFNIETMLNENWDKIDSAVGQVREEISDIDIPLSDATNGNRSNVAASEKAVGQVMSAAQAAQTTANAANTAAAAAQNTANSASSAAAAASNAVGPLSSLLTSAKGNAVAAINELFTSASNGKNEIAAAITGKGVPASGSDTFPVLAQKIWQISTDIKVASGLLTPNITQSSPYGTISNLPFAPKILLLYVQPRVFHTGPVISAAAQGYIMAYNINGSMIIGDYAGTSISEPSFVNSNINFQTATFGVNSVSFELRFFGDYPYGSAVRYIVFGT